MPSYLKSMTTANKTAPAALVAGKNVDESELIKVQNSEIKSFMATIVNKWDLSNITLGDIINFFAYEGFDPKMVYRHILAIQAKDQHDESTRNGDITMLLVLQHIKGNINSNNFKSLSPEAQNVVNMLLERWGISLKIGNEKKKTVTLPRLAAAFPLQTAIIARESIKDFVGPFASAGLPNFMKTSSFASLVPVCPISNFILAAYNCYATDQSITLKKYQWNVMDDQAKITAYNEQYKYTNISFQSVVMSSEGRKRSMILLGMKDEYATLKDVLNQSDYGRTKLIDEADWDQETARWVISGVDPL